MTVKKQIENVGGVYSDILDTVEIVLEERFGTIPLVIIQEAQKHAVVYFNRGYAFGHAIDQAIYDIVERKYTVH